MNRLLPLALAAGLVVAAGPALALPVLETEVDTANRIVTVGDMFKDAGALAGQPLFLAPAPGTAGDVPIEEIRAAALKAGLDDFDDQGAAEVRVSRLATPVTNAALTALLGNELRTRGLLTEGVTPVVAFDAAVDGINAAAVPQPIQLLSLRYAPDSGLFSARFVLAGVEAPLDLTGTVTLMASVPELRQTLPANALLAADDIVEQQVPLRYIQYGDVATPDQLVGKVLLRQSRAGAILRVSDVTDPQVVARNDSVTVYLRAGGMTLSVKGTALNSASAGQPVAVLNTISKHVVHGVAQADGSVAISVSPISVAGL